MNRLALWTLVAVWPAVCHAQTDSTRQVLVLFEGGPTSYRGDLANPQTGAHGAVALVWRANKANPMSLHLGAGGVAAQDREFEVRDAEGQLLPVNTFFESRLAFGYIQYHIRLYHRGPWSFYVSPGLGLLRFSPTDAQGESLANRTSSRLLGEDYGTTAPMLPLSANVRYALPSGFFIGLAGGWWNPLTDYLDNIGQLGTRSGNDQLLSIQAQLWIPLRLR